MLDNNYVAISKLISPHNKAGGKTILSHEKERIVFQRLKFFTTREAAIECRSLRYMMAKNGRRCEKGICKWNTK